MSTNFRGAAIRTVARPTCYVCGARGVEQYFGLKDRLFDAPGSWNLKRCSDSGCGIYWLDPMPIEADLNKLYSQYYTHHDEAVHSGPGRLKAILNRANAAYLNAKFGYATSSTNDPLSRLLGVLLRLSPARCADLDFSVFYLPHLPNGHLLEVGCGSGRMLAGMATRGWRVTGIDFDEQAVTNAKNKGLDVYHGVLSSQNFRENSFDAIVMSHVIEHVPEPRELLRECFRVLKPGGTLVVITPNVQGRLHKAFKESWRGLEPPRHLHLFSPAALSRLIVDAGFAAAVKLETTVRDVAGLWAASYSLANNIPGAEKGGLLNRRILRKIVSLVLSYQHLFDRTHGDEVVAVGRKV
jgi:2-polyprenyl-3-methyl-5-hydroxy-6-metoxy-1,4-benzoquinol methylase